MRSQADVERVAVAIMKELERNRDQAAKGPWSTAFVAALAAWDEIAPELPIPEQPDLPNFVAPEFDLSQSAEEAPIDLNAAWKRKAGLA